MKITGGAYEFVLPVAFLPNYKQHEPIRISDDMEAVLEPQYTFQYGFDIVSRKKITFVGAPKGAQTLKTETGYKIEHGISDKIPSREIKISYKTEDMLLPSLLYKVQGLEVACMASFVPTFEPQHP